MKCCDITAGMLRHKISLQQELNVSDDAGGYTKTWNTYAVVWAKITPKGARETFTGMKIEHTITHDIIIRYISGVAPKDKVMYNDRELSIEGIVNIDERNVWLKLSCEEIS